MLQILIKNPQGVVTNVLIHREETTAMHQLFESNSINLQTPEYCQVQIQLINICNSIFVLF